MSGFRSNIKNLYEDVSESYEYESPQSSNRAYGGQGSRGGYGRGQVIYNPNNILGRSDHAVGSYSYSHASTASPEQKSSSNSSIEKKQLI